MVSFHEGFVPDAHVLPAPQDPSTLLAYMGRQAANELRPPRVLALDHFSRPLLLRRTPPSTAESANPVLGDGFGDHGYRTHTSEPEPQLTVFPEAQALAPGSRIQDGPSIEEGPPRPTALARKSTSRRIEPKHQSSDVRQVRAAGRIPKYHRPPQRRR